MALQQKTAEALVELVTEEIPEQLVVEELRERIHDLNHRLESQGMTLGQFLGATGRDEQEFLDELRAGALQSVKVDLALRALVERRRSRSATRSSTRSWPPWASASKWTPTRYGSSWTGPGAFRRYARTGARPRPCDGWSTTSSWSMRRGKPVSRDDLKVNQGEEDSE